MFSLLYRSTVSTSLKDTDILKLFEFSKVNNDKKGITGCILHHNDTFVQFIEGTESKVRELYDKIKNDARHTHFFVLHLEENVTTLFADFNFIFHPKGSTTEEIRRKRMLFDTIFHESGIIGAPGAAKLILWSEVHQLLQEKKDAVAS